MVVLYANSGFAKCSSQYDLCDDVPYVPTCLGCSFALRSYVVYVLTSLVCVQALHARVP